MSKQSQTFLYLAAVALVATSACTKSNSNHGNGNPSGISTAAPVDRSVAASSSSSAGAYVPGTPSQTSDVVAMTVFLPGGAAASDAELAPIFLAYPSLGLDANLLALVDKSVLTTDGHIELYQGTNLLMVLAISGNVATVVWVNSAFTVDSISYASAADLSSVLTFNFSACTVVADPTPTQDKTQGKVPPKAPVCQNLSANIDMAQQPQKQQQDQGKGQDQGQSKP